MAYVLQGVSEEILHSFNLLRERNDSKGHGGMSIESLAISNLLAMELFSRAEERIA